MSPAATARDEANSLRRLLGVSTEDPGASILDAAFLEALGRGRCDLAEAICRLACAERTIPALDTPVALLAWRRKLASVREAVRLAVEAHANEVLDAQTADELSTTAGVWS